MVQYYKGDDTELKFDASAEPTLSAVEQEKDDFFDGAYACFVLGELLWDNELSPLARAIARDIFRESFSTIFEQFRFAGTFEAYMEVFRAIFGEDVDVTFTVPAAGKLNIDIEAAGIVLSDLVARRIEDNAYVLDEIVDYDGDNIALQSIKGFETEYELEQMLFEMVPAGIYTQITLTVGGL